MLPSYYLLFVFGFWKPHQADTPLCSILNQDLQMTVWIGFPLSISTVWLKVPDLMLLPFVCSLN